MRKLIAILIMMLLCCGVALAENGVTLWGLGQESFDWTQSSITGRIGYEFANPGIECFLGSTWWPNYKTDEGEMEPPQVYSVGAVYYWIDLVDPNNPIPWIPPLLLKVIPEKFVAQPYLGGQCSLNIDEDAGYLGAVIGLSMKARPDDKTSLIAEAQFNNMFKDLVAIPDEWRLNLGFRILF